MRLLIALALVAAAVAQDPRLPRSLGSASFPDPPAFMEVYVDEDAEDNEPSAQTLYISTFRPGNVILFQYDDVYYLRGPGQYFREPEKLVDEMTLVANDMKWPNNPDLLPSAVVGRQGVIWNSGFLVPGKKEGHLNLYFNDEDGFDGPYNIASDDDEDWSYHRVIWKDVDSDGDLDAMVARFRTGTFGTVTKDFSWLENPGQGLNGLEGWNQHFITKDGPDVHFRNLELEGDDGPLDAFVFGEFWEEKIAVWYTENNDWSDANIEYNVRRVQVDAPGQVFDLYLDDFNLDGKLDLLATVYDGETGHVYVYDIPENWQDGHWPRRSIASGFKANYIFGGQSMTPGSPKPFWPSKAAKEAGLKPYISLSGDDDGKLYILAPVSEDKDNWIYDTLTLVDTEETTSGKIAISDFDNDGYTDLIAAGYSAETLYVFTFEPEPEAETQ